MKHTLSLFLLGIGLTLLLTGCPQIFGDNSGSADAEESTGDGAESGTEDDTPATAEIQLAVEGLPGGGSYRLDMAALLSGPDGDEPIAAGELGSRVQDLPPGEYTVSFETLRHVGEIVDTIYEPEPMEQTLSLAAGENATVSVTYSRRPGSGMLWASLDGASSDDPEMLSAYDASDLLASGTPDPAVAFDLKQIMDPDLDPVRGYQPKGIAVGADGSIWVARESSAALDQFTADQLVDSQTTPNPALRLLLEDSSEGEIRPTGIAFDASGNLYIADRWWSVVLRYNGIGDRVGDSAAPATETIGPDLEITDWSCGSTENDCYENYDYRVGSLHDVTVTVDKDGSVWFGNGGIVTNSGTLYQSGWVTTYGADTLAANGSRWTTAVDGFFDAAAEPLRLAFDAEGGLWVANTHQNDGYTGDFSELQLGRIYHYDDPDLAAENRISDSVQGADVTVVLTNGNAEVYPGAMAFDNSGYLWIYDRNSSSLGRYDVASLDGDSTSLEPDIVISGVATSRGPGYLAFNPPPLDSPIHVPGQ